MFCNNSYSYGSEISRNLFTNNPVAHMGERSGAYRILVGKPEGWRPLGRLMRRWNDNIKMDLTEVVWEEQT